MKQFEIEKNTLTLYVKKSPFIIRIIFLIISILFFLLPISGMIAAILNGDPLKFGYFIVIGLSGLLGFYIFRIYLWNSFGKEVIILNKNEISYEADYKYFKDGRKLIAFDTINFNITSIGYKEENLGLLTIGHEESKIESVVKLPINQLEELIQKIENKK